MADVTEKPKVRCDNCGVVAEKVNYAGNMQTVYFVRPRLWGGMVAEGGTLIDDTYGTGKEKIAFVDLCPECADAAFTVAAAALKERRGGI